MDKVPDRHFSKENKAQNIISALNRLVAEGLEFKSILRYTVS